MESNEKSIFLKIGLWWCLCTNIYFAVVVFCLAESEDGEDEQTGISEGGWREEKPNTTTQLSKEMERESGEMKLARHGWIEIWGYIMHLHIHQIANV